MTDKTKTYPRIPHLFDEYTNSEIRRAAETGFMILEAVDQKENSLILMICFF